MSKMDLSELYEDVQANFKPQSQDHVAKGVELERIKENMARLTGKVTGMSKPGSTSIQVQKEGNRL